MNRPSLCRLILWIVNLAAVGAVFLALGAGALGIDQDGKWGPIRWGLLIIGLIVISARALDIALKALDRHFARARAASADHSIGAHASIAEGTPTPRTDAAGNQVFEDAPGKLEHVSNSDLADLDRTSDTADSRSATTFPTKRSDLLKLAVLLVTIELMYLGLASVWNWTKLPPTTQRYASLATAFTKGKTELPIEASPRLAELDNPYSPEEREGIPVVGDYSYYQGKYYMYWGPAPAGLMALWILLGGQVLSDGFIVLLAGTIIFLSSALILYRVWRRAFHSLPGWLLPVAMVIVATSHPLLWSLNSPSIYMAAIASGQAFLLSGLALAVPLIEESRRPPWRYAIVGVLWTLAVGSRLTLVGVVAILTGAVIAAAFYGSQPTLQRRHVLVRALGLMLPLALGAVLLGLYNLVRFDNPLETGFRFAMVGYDTTQLLAEGRIFSFHYLVPNLLHYLLTPIRLIPEFPWLRPHWHVPPTFLTVLTRLNTPPEYSVQNAAGLLFSMPSLVFVGLIFRALLCEAGQIGPEHSLGTIRRTGSELIGKRILLTLGLASIFSAAPVLLYKVSSARFLLEFIPIAAILACIGAWQAYRAARPFTVRSLFMTGLIASTLVVGALISFLLALSGADSRFDDANPVLYEFLRRVLSW